MNVITQPRPGIRYVRALVKNARVVLYQRKDKIDAESFPGISYFSATLEGYEVLKGHGRPNCEPFHIDYAILSLNLTINAFNFFGFTPCRDCIAWKYR